MKKQCAIVFDFDETIGHFIQPYNFWYNLKKFLNDETLDENYFHSFLDLFPNYFRTNIFKIFKFLKKKKISGQCNFVAIYTNNNGPSFWINIIKSYIHKKLKYNLFDQIIRAYKINGRVIEENRTSYKKSHSDLLNCTKLSYTTQICFIDDQYHTDMNHKNVFYIYIQPYIYNIDYNIICSKYFNKNIELFKKYNKNQEEFSKYLFDLKNNTIKNENKSQLQKNIDFLISKKIEHDIKKFFNKNTRKTIKTIKNKNHTKNNQTRKFE